ncbi:N-acetyltransferase [Micromonospora sp. KC213]|uniref:GNAT family N-acetyltransferase n=1 Tax=Micromonospora sp. KC213 TaxID=2530378 RepID=UPI001FB85B8F|nr:N-acetyltransferase [Micromonospora sp. KC213]
MTATLEEITLRRDHGRDYRYTYVLCPVTDSPKPHTHEEPHPAMAARIWHTRPEAGPDDRAAIRRINLSAFPGPVEADLVDALREDRQAWLPWSSWLAEDPNGTPAGFALLTRCHVDDVPALALGPCAVLAEQQRTGAGSTAIRAALDAARAAGENLVLVLGHAPYYPRFGFMPASGYGIRPPFDVPDENMMALVLDSNRPVPRGTIRYAAAFGV